MRTSPHVRPSAKRRNRTGHYARLTLCALLFWLSETTLALAAERPMFFRVVDSATGLSQNTVFAITQDASGHMWLGTEQGLNRFDGLEIDQFHREPGASGGLPDSFIYALAAAPAGGVWIATARGGLAFYEPATGNISPVLPKLSDPASTEPLQVRSLRLRADGKLWLGTLGRGALLFDPATGSAVSLQELVGSADPDLDSLNVYAFEGDGDDWWLATDTGIVHAQLLQRNVERFAADTGQADQLQHNEIRDLLLTTDGRLWAATLGGGLSVSDDRGAHWQTFRHTAGDAQTISSDRVNALFLDREQRLWIGTAGGLNRLRPQDNSFERYENDGRPNSLGDNDVLQIAEDRTGLLWFGTRGRGTSTWNPQSWELGHQRSALINGQSISSFASTEQAHYIGTVGGGLIERRAGQETRIGRAQGLTDERVMSLTTDLRDQVWIGTMTQGLFRLDPERSVVQPMNTDANGVPWNSMGIMSLHRGADGQLWVGTHRAGLWRLNPYSGEQLPLKDSLEPLLPNRQILALAEATRGGLWVGTDAGLYLVHPRFGVQAHFSHNPQDASSIAGDTIYALHLDSQQQLWIGTSDGGLSRLTGDPSELHTVTFNSLLPTQLKANSIYGIESDADDNLWLSSNNGLLKVSQNPISLYQFRAELGAQGAEFNYGAHYQDQWGELYFGGADGFNGFDPLKVNFEQPSAPVVLTRFEPRGGHTIRLSMSSTDDQTLKLAYNENSFSFRFALLDYTNPQENAFAFRLMGFDETWSAPTQDRIATFTNLDPGTYRFEVNGQSSSGTRSSNTAYMTLTIAPPPWASPPAYALYLLVVLSVIALVLRNLRRRELRRRAYQQRLEQEVVARTAELEESNGQLARATRAKSDFLARMSHEIRTPMNGVYGTAELLKRSRLDKKQEQYVSTIHRSCGALIALINDILDFSKIEAGKLTLEVVPFDLQEVVDEVANLFAYQAGQKGLTVLVDSQLPTFPMNGDPLRIRQILSNLVGNAVKFTEHGYIELRVRVSAQAVELSVSDTGIGIAADKQQQIFEDFAQEDGSTSRRFGGSGLGLSICRELAELMQGTVGVTSNSGHGSIFTLTIPVEAQAGQPPIGPDLSRTRVLLVLTDRRQSDLLEAQLSPHCETVRRAPSTVIQELNPSLLNGIDSLICDSRISISLGELLNRRPTDQPPLRVIVVGDSAVRDGSGYQVSELAYPLRLAQVLTTLATGADGTASASADPAFAALPKLRNGARLLLVEDNEVNQEVIGGMLEAIDATFDIAATGPDALARCQAQQYDLILMDCGLPGMDGYDVTRHLRRDSAGYQQIPIIALTANNLSGERDICLAAGMTDFLPKPCPLIDLAAMLERYLPAPESAGPSGSAALSERTSQLAAAGASTLPPVPSIQAVPQEAANDSGSTTVVIDPNAIKQILALERNGRSGMVERIITLFERDLRQTLTDLPTLVSSGNCEAARALAHKAKSSSANVGAIDYADYWNQLEQALAVQDTALATTLLSSLKEQMEPILAQLALLTDEHRRRA